MKIKLSKKRIFFTIIFLVFALTPFVVFRIWSQSKFNQVGNLLLCNSDYSKIYEMSKGKLIIWELDISKNISKKRFWPPIVYRLPNGNTLIIESDAGIVYEIDKQKKIVWSCDSLYKMDNFVFELSFPIKAQRLENGNTIIGDLGQRKIVEVNKHCEIIWEWDYIDEDIDYRGELANFYRFNNDNIGVLIFKVREYKQNSVKEHRNIDFFKYIELDRNQNLKRHLTLDKISDHSVNAKILPNGNILVSYGEHGVVEFDSLNHIVWSFQLPDSLEVYEVLPLPGAGPEHTQPGDKIPAFASAAWRFSNGNTAIYSLHLVIYLVSPDNKLLLRVKNPTIKSIFGIKFLKEGNGSDICHLVGIVDR